MNEYISHIENITILMMLIEAVMMWVMNSADDEDKNFYKSIIKVVLAFIGGFLFALLGMCTYSFFS